MCSGVRYPAPSPQSTHDQAVDESGEAGRFGTPPQPWMAAAGRRMRKGAWLGPDWLGPDWLGQSGWADWVRRPGAPGLLQGQLLAPGLHAQRQKKQAQDKHHRGSGHG
jgi:hypothetical protein